MIVELDEIKNVMKIETNDEDDIITNMLSGSIALVKNILRVTDFTKFNKQGKNLIKTAIYYAVTYKYDFREKGNMKELELNLRSMLNTLREVLF